jgi:hypothetical protein
MFLERKKFWFRKKIDFFVKFRRKKAESIQNSILERFYPIEMLMRLNELTLAAILLDLVSKSIRPDFFGLADFKFTFPNLKTLITKVDIFAME